MWPFRKKQPQRRLEVRKRLAAGEESFWQRFRLLGGPGIIFITGVMYLAFLLMDVWPMHPLGYRQGQYVPHDIHARVDFRVPIESPVLSPRQSETERAAEAPATRPATMPATAPADVGGEAPTTMPAGEPPTKVTPATVQRYNRHYAGEVIVRSSRDKIAAGKEEAGLGAVELQLLRIEHDAHVENLLNNHPWRFRFQVLGRALVLLAIMSLAGAYLFYYRRDIISQPRRTISLSVLLIAAVGLNKLLGQSLSLNPYITVLPVMIVGVIVAIAYDQRFALAATALVALVGIIQLRQELIMILAPMAATYLAVFMLREIRTRSKLIEVSAISAVTAAAAVLAVDLANGVPWRFIVTDGLWAGGAAVMAGFLVQGALPAVEKVFRCVTSMTLLEWCDASKPLLKRLAMEAPGTYNHCLQLGAICEAASEAIGARGLLARVGAYYHDIGKLNKPAYFVENQGGEGSKHEKLSPAMSLLVITGHVKDGLEMAREYGLPEVLHEFIATHHGTTLVQYFYHAAAEKSRRQDERQPDEMEFRYPGPKPRSKEAAILMLADAAESSVRAMSEPNPTRIESQVHVMVNRRLMDGQLDNCDLTLREVHQIETSLTRSLCGIYHARISYPAPAGKKSAPSETPNGGPDDKSARQGEGDESRRDPRQRYTKPPTDEA